MKTVKRILAWIEFILTGKGEIANEGVEAGVLDYSGQGKDRYGK